MLRLFLALDLDDAQRAALVALRGEAPPHIARAGRWSPLPNLHLTLRFLGDWPERRLGELTASLATVRADAAPLRLRGLGCFPNRGNARVLWAGVAADAALGECRANVVRALEGLGFSAPKQPFAPHITLARFRPPLPRLELTPWLAARREWEGPAALVTHFTLYESKLGHGPPRYLPLARFPLSPCCQGRTRANTGPL